jgi:hypothetical protein
MTLPREFYRHGPDVRQGQQVSFVEVRRRFDFASIRIGRWVTQPEQERAAGLFYDALVDLMSILQCPESLISLRGSLSLQYGIGGRPGVAAHYQPSMRCFSLAKNAGPGSIAHEWFHAFDHYLGSTAFDDASSGMFASKAWLSEATPVVHPLNDDLYACFRNIMLGEDGESPSQLFQVSARIDRAMNQVYYSQPEELCARAFEAFIQDAAITNNFLVSGTKATTEAQQGLYPMGEQRERINLAFQHYFNRLGAALNREMSRSIR